MKKIKLTRGRFAIVDDDDYEMLKKHSWHCLEIHTEGKYYAGTTVRITKQKQYSLKMHRYIMGLKRGDGKLIDHINNDGLDNRKKNLRIVSYSENNKNRSVGKNNTTGSKGIYLEKQTGKYKVQINNNGIRHYLGKYSTIDEAKQVRALKEKELYGKYSRG